MRRFLPQITQPRRPAASGTVLLLTLMMLVLLTFEVAVISLVAQRGFSEEGVLQTQNIASRRGTELVLNRMQESLYNYIRQNGTTNVNTLFAMGGANAIAEQDLTITNPTGGSNTTDVRIAAWLEEKRGVWYHLVGRAKSGSTDLVSHRWIKMNLCQQGVGGLTTIITGQTKPGYPRGVAADSEGRVFFAEGGNANADTVWTWKSTTGLSTIVSGVNNPGINGSLKATSDGRVFIGNGGAPGSFWTWKDGILSTLVNGEGDPGYATMDLDSSGRIYFGENWAGNNANTVWSWKEEYGLSTVKKNDGTYFTNPGYEGMHATRDNGVAFGEFSTSGRMYYWKNGQLSTVLVLGETNPGYKNSVKSYTDGRIYFGEGKISGGHCLNCQFYSWKNNVLTTITPASFDNPGLNSTVVGDSGRVYWGEMTSPSKFWSWHASTGLSTVLSGQCWPGEGENILEVSGRMYVGGCSYLWTWQNNILSTIISSTYPGYMVSDSGGTVYFGTGNGGAGSFYSWKQGVGLSTLVSGVTTAGMANTFIINSNSRLYFGEYGGGGSFWTWKSGVLSTIATGITHPGFSSSVLSGTNIFFGQDTDPGAFWGWTPPATCDSLGY